MALQKLLSIDVRQDIVCGVMLSAGAREITVVSCALAVIEERTLAEALAEVLLHVGYQDEPCRVTLAAEQFLYRNLSFPFADKRKINRILPIELEESIPVSMETMLVDSLVAAKTGNESAVIAAMINREFLRQQLTEMQSLGLDPDIVAIAGVQTALQMVPLYSQGDFVLLDAGCRRVTMYVISAGRMQLVRSIAFDDGSLANFSFDRNSQLVSAHRPEKIEETLGVMCREINRTLQTLVEVDGDMPIFLIGALAGVKEAGLSLNGRLGREVKPCEFIGKRVKIGMGCGLWRSDVMTSALALGLRPGKSGNGFNFRRDEFVKKRSLRKYRKQIARLGVSLAVCLAVVIGYLWNDFAMGEKELQSLKLQGEQVFAATLPDISRIVDPVQQLQAEIKALKKGTLGEDYAQTDIKVLDLLAEISVRIPTSLNVHIVRMVTDGDSILLRGLTDNFNTVDNLKKVLEKSPYFTSVTISSANLAQKEAGINFELKLQLNRA